MEFRFYRHPTRVTVKRPTKITVDRVLVHMSPNDPSTAEPALALVQHEQLPEVIQSTLEPESLHSIGTIATLRFVIDSKTGHVEVFQVSTAVDQPDDEERDDEDEETP